MTVKQEIGNVYGRLTVISQVLSVREKAAWLCQCECGNTHTATGDSLRRGSVRSCGCYRLSGDYSVTHGHTRGGTKGVAPTGTYVSWIQMVKRCDNPKDISFPNYGGRGITYDPAWKDFEAFYADMGDRPEGLSLDRENNDKNYSKDNCRWATKQEQSVNRRTNQNITHQGRTQTISQWAAELGIKYGTLYARLILDKKPPEIAFNLEVRTRCKQLSTLRLK